MFCPLRHHKKLVRTLFSTYLVYIKQLIALESCIHMYTQSLYYTLLYIVVCNSPFSWFTLTSPPWPRIYTLCKIHFIDIHCNTLHELFFHLNDLHKHTFGQRGFWTDDNELTIWDQQAGNDLIVTSFKCSFIVNALVRLLNAFY